MFWLPHVAPTSWDQHKIQHAIEPGFTRKAHYKRRTSREDSSSPFGSMMFKIDRSFKQRRTAQKFARYL